ncbi:hypothetical protein C8R47DRAFT_654831 [Mycena vitilis]|nr:hypothetical protein C8R47DRAFT_654831 [Mycena vitilis]
MALARMYSACYLCCFRPCSPPFLGLRRIKAYSLHPGAVFTNMMRKQEGREELIAMSLLKPDGQLRNALMEWKSIPEGAATTVAAALDTRIEDQPGAFLFRERQGCSSDPENVAKLWTVTEEIVGEKFAF